MGKRDKLEPLADGYVAFHTESGERWRHRDITESSPGQPTRHVRLFVSGNGEERRYVFAPTDPRDATVWDLRDQLRKAQPTATAGAAAAPT